MTPEQQLEQAVVQLYSAAGGVVISFAQGYRPQPGGTRQTPGISDLEIWWPHRRALSKHETKTEEGLGEHLRLVARPATLVPKSLANDWRRAQAQARYRGLCQQCGIPYGIGGLQAAAAVIRQVTGRAVAPVGW